MLVDELFCATKMEGEEENMPLDEDVEMEEEEEKINIDCEDVYKEPKDMDWMEGDEEDMEWESCALPAASAPVATARLAVTPSAVLPVITHLCLSVTPSVLPAQLAVTPSAQLPVVPHHCQNRCQQLHLICLPSPSHSLCQHERL